MSKQITYTNPPLAGRPPFGTDEPDHIYEQQQPQRRPNVHDNYANEANRQSGVGALGMGLLNGDMDSDDEEDENPFSNRHSYVPPKSSPLATSRSPSPSQPAQPSSAIPLASPKPSYANNPVHNLDSIARPEPSATPVGRTPSPSPPYSAGPQMVQMPRPSLTIPSSPISPHHTSPVAPHPLPPTITPITPVFARRADGETGSVKFEDGTSKVIIRGNAESTVLPKRGEKGDDFWRRFSMIAKEDRKESPWLKKTQSGSTRLSRWVWIIGMLLLLCIAGGIGIGIYISHKNQSNTGPKAIGGSADEAATVTTTTTAISSAATVKAVGVTTGSPHVSPTNTVARRDGWYDVLPTPVALGKHGRIVRGLSRIVEGVY
ncbi:hypothetical protein JAAARDRAFT_44863 [Jaapia argillacea MUCL 33604]|uniref:Uncharacterized protein n=1 Tax=Jaapia argillacea MUCL 33604 TaxID=933084 RepID=A0A067Q6F7_9AGAM|nr:hypothetical protein JAAARDRAFT_44863 [Jaapia argillacea MUCL 33604]